MLTSAVRAGQRFLEANLSTYNILYSPGTILLRVNNYTVIVENQRNDKSLSPDPTKRTRHRRTDSTGRRPMGHAPGPKATESVPSVSSCYRTSLNFSTQTVTHVRAKIYVRSHKLLQRHPFTWKCIWFGRPVKRASVSCFTAGHPPGRTTALTPAVSGLRETCMFCDVHNLRATKRYFIITILLNLCLVRTAGSDSTRSVHVK